MSHKIHRFQASDMGLAVNAYIIEGSDGVVVVDATLLRSDSLALSQKVKDIGKPLRGILVTHSHPDHIAGLTTLVGDHEVPILATQAVVDLMYASEEAKHDQWSEMFGDEWIHKWTYPNQIVKDGQTLRFDELRFTVYDIGGGGDCEANSIWMLESNRPRAFVGDIIYHENFTYMNDGQVLRWIANLDRYSGLLHEAEKLYIGHGKEGGPEMIEMQKSYLNDYCCTLLKLTRGTAELDEHLTGEFVKEMESKYPEYGLNFMIGLSAAKVATELR